MELFPAASEDQWSLIKGVIDDCDYYVVVIAGRYGSIGPDGISYTEMEYRYALEIGKPVIAFLHGDAASIPAKYCETTDEGRSRLEKFRAMAQQKMCKNWKSSQELGSVVSRSLVKLQRSHPGIGWVRGNLVPSKDTTLEILRLRKRIDDLESELNTSHTQPPKGAVGLAQHDDVFEVKVDYETHRLGQSYEWNGGVSVTWNELFFAISPLLLHEATTAQVHARLVREIKERVLSQFKATDEAPLDADHDGHYVMGSKIDVSRTDLETIVVQFLALGYIERSAAKNRSVKDRGDYWTLTPFGTTVMNQLRAIPSGAGAVFLSRAALESLPS